MSPLSQGGLNTDNAVLQLHQEQCRGFVEKFGCNLTQQFCPGAVLQQQHRTSSQERKGNPSSQGKGALVLNWETPGQSGFHPRARARPLGSVLASLGARKGQVFCKQPEKGSPEVFSLPPLGVAVLQFQRHLLSQGLIPVLPEEAQRGEGQP